VPDSPNQPYDILDLIHSVVDEGNFLEVHAHYARNIVVGFARLGGRSVGVVANQPAHLAGTLDIDASVKGARFCASATRSTSRWSPSRTCPGSCPARPRSSGASSGTARSCCSAFAEATVPKVTVIARKAYGGAYCVMASKHIRTDVNLAWPTAEIAVMGPEGAVNILYKRELDAAPDPAALRAAKVAEFARSWRTRSWPRPAASWTR